MASSWEEAMSIFDKIIKEFKFSNASKVEKAIAALPESRKLQLFQEEPEDIFARLQAYNDKREGSFYVSYGLRNLARVMFHKHS
jgi:hypothetical protein